MPPAAASDVLTRLAAVCLGVVEASRVGQNAELHRQVVTFLVSDDTPYPVEANVGLCGRLTRRALSTSHRGSV